MATRVVLEPAWSEAKIAHAIGRQVFNNAILMVPCCGWTGHECDLLVVERGLRIIDVEIKISRADLKADAAKDKWWVDRPWSRRHEIKTKSDWPPKVWKHYYVLPTAIWDAKLLPALNAASGVILISGSRPTFEVIRKARPNTKALRISPADAINIARLASLRMWASLIKD